MIIDCVTNRVFQIWEYRVSHGTLLIRSPKDDLVNKNLDFIFGGVEYINLPRFIYNLAIDEANELEYEAIKNSLQKQIAKSSVFIVSSNGIRFQLVAATFRACENNLDIFDTSLLR